MGLLRAGVLGFGTVGGLFLIGILLGTLGLAEGPGVFVAAGFLVAGTLFALGLFRATFRA
ncbi:hypothetical protein [Haloarchaeobius sp. HME9146]|uniref:hypothetical protein n=1 Tax=Haloarchaeobius sp. HME9146 TaxID=2978732 RepID=UPI0021BF7053|nr:hypothetical protein [Haloarchaeobius sp. HME9146]MCT9096188.1 hypothetical protein [Haloarchaeobius sp. HME9146]